MPLLVARDECMGFAISADACLAMSFPCYSLQYRLSYRLGTLPGVCDDILLQVCLARCAREGQKIACEMIGFDDQQEWFSKETVRHVEKLWNLVPRSQKLEHLRQ